MVSQNFHLVIRYLLGKCSFSLQKINESGMSITDFRERIIEKLFFSEEETISETIELNCTNARKRKSENTFDKKEELFIKPENTVSVATKKNLMELYQKTK